MYHLIGSLWRVYNIGCFESFLVYNIASIFIHLAAQRFTMLLGEALMRRMSLQRRCSLCRGFTRGVCKPPSNGRRWFGNGRRRRRTRLEVRGRGLMIVVSAVCKESKRSSRVTRYHYILVYVMSKTYRWSPMNDFVAGWRIIWRCVSHAFSVRSLRRYNSIPMFTIVS